MEMIADPRYLDRGVFRVDSLKIMFSTSSDVEEDMDKNDETED